MHAVEFTIKSMRPLQIIKSNPHVFFKFKWPHINILLAGQPIKEKEIVIFDSTNGDRIH